MKLMNRRKAVKLTFAALPAAELALSSKRGVASLLTGFALPSDATPLLYEPEMELLAMFQEGPNCNTAYVYDGGGGSWGSTCEYYLDGYTDPGAEVDICAITA